MPAQPNEPASESIKNALQVLNAEEPYESCGQRWVEYAAEDVEAIRALLEAALKKLEAYSAPFGYFPDGITLPAECVGTVLGYPDLEERQGAASEPPRDVLKRDAADFASRLARDVDAQIMGFTNVKPEDRALMGQDVDADGE